MTNFGTVNYASTDTPSGYVCHCCGATNIKLWRDYNSFLEYIQLFCAQCAAKKQKIDIDSISFSQRLHFIFI